ncbi:MAG TPA: YozE family protein [Bacillus bacterium]|nr:YozE family protein [Bacillus sp. (in: firmicutes)]
MNKTFYQYVLKYRTTKKGDLFGQFAEEIYKDHSFPKYSSDYHEISSYLELSETALNSIIIFDQIWEMYEQDVIGI